LTEGPRARDGEAPLVSPDTGMIGYSYARAHARARETDRMMLSNRDRRDEN
jgi:hypothetical protein